MTESMMPHRVETPFSPDQVESLNGYQASGFMHAFTCGHGGHDHGRLRATEAGWVCDHDGCEYTQHWAWGFMANGDWREMRDTLNLRFPLESAAPRSSA